METFERIRLLILATLHCLGFKSAACSDKADLEDVKLYGLTALMVLRLHPW